jgi:hypothetical protein
MVNPFTRTCAMPDWTGCLHHLPCQISHQRSFARTFYSAARTSDLPAALSRLPRAQVVCGAHKSLDRPHKLSNVRPDRTDERTSRLPAARSARIECGSLLPRPLCSLPRPQVVCQRARTPGHARRSSDRPREESFFLGEEADGVREEPDQAHEKSASHTERRTAAQTLKIVAQLHG